MCVKKRNEEQHQHYAFSTEKVRWCHSDSVEWAQFIVARSETENQHEGKAVDLIKRFYLTMPELSFAQKVEQNCTSKPCLDESTLGIVIIERQFACAWQQEKNYTRFYLFGAAPHNIYLCMAQQQCQQTRPEWILGLKSKHSTCNPMVQIIQVCLFCFVFNWEH